MTGQSLTDVATEYQDTNLPDVSTALVMEFADLVDVDVHELPPLYGVIDPEALNRLLHEGDESVRVSFDYCERRITVAGDGTVTIDTHH